MEIVGRWVQIGGGNRAQVGGDRGEVGVDVRVQIWGRWVEMRGWR